MSHNITSQIDAAKAPTQVLSSISDNSGFRKTHNNELYSDTQIKGITLVSGESIDGRKIHELEQLNQSWKGSGIMDDAKAQITKARQQLRLAFNSLRGLPLDERKKLSEEFDTDIRYLNGKPPRLPKPAPEGKDKLYPLYVKRTDPMKHLETHWGEWLTEFTPELDKDYLDQKTLRALDPVLFHAVKNHIYNKTDRKLVEILPAYTAEN